MALEPKLIWQGNPISNEHQPDPSQIVDWAQDKDARVASLEGLNIQSRLDTLEGAVTSGQVAKAPVALLVDFNTNLTGEKTVDGTLTSASRVAVTGQANAAENGIYITSSGGWSRADDMDVSGDVHLTTVLVLGGAAYGGQTWKFQVDDPATFALGADAIGAVQVSDAGALQDYVDAGLQEKLSSANSLSELAGAAATARGNIGAAAQTALTDTAGRINYIVSGIGGTANAVTASLADTAVGGAAVSLTRGMVLHDFPWPGTNTGGVTLDIGGAGAVAVQDEQGNALPAGALATSDRVSLVYTGFAWRLVGQGYRRIWDRRLRPQRLQTIDLSNPDAIIASTADGTVTQHTRGQFFFGRIGNGGNSGGAVTVNIAGLGALRLYEADGSDPAKGRLAASTEYLFQYDGTDFILWAPSPDVLTVADVAPPRPTAAKMLSVGENLGHYASPYALAGADAFEPPAGLGWSATRPVYASLIGGTWLCSVNPRALVSQAIWGGAVIYVDPENGDDSNDGSGTYWGDYSKAKLTLHAAITAGNATGAPFIIRVREGEANGENWATDNGAVEPSQHMAILCDGPVRYRVGAWTNAWTLDSGTCYYTAATSIGRVLRTDELDARGHYTDLEHTQDSGESDAAALAAVRSTEGTFWRDLTNGRVYVNIGREPGNRDVALLRNVRGLEFDSATPKDIYIENLHTEGGIDGAFAVTGAGARNIVAVNCSFLYQGHRTQLRNSVSVTQTEGLVAMFGVDGSKGQKDGFGYHSDAGAGLSVLHINCVSTDSGRLGETSVNGFTTHDTVKSIDIGGRYGWGTNGTEVHCIEQTKSWFLGTRATARDQDGTCGAFKCSEDAVMYLEETFADAAGGATNNYAIEANGGTVLKRNHTNIAGTEETSGAGSIGTF